MAKVKKAKKINQINFYTYRITWSEKDNEFVGLCAEFPSLSWLDETPEGALKGIRNLVSEVVADMESNQEDIPEPLELKKYSGTFVVRVPPLVHKELSIQAAENNISINRLINSKLNSL